MKEELKLLFNKAQKPLLLLNKSTPHLTQSSPQRAELREIYKELKSKTYLNPEDKYESNRLTIQCILKMFDTERAILYDRCVDIDKHSKEDIKCWLKDAGNILIELEDYYQDKGGEVNFEFYVFKLNKLGLEAAYFYHLLLSLKLKERGAEASQFIQKMIEMFKLIKSFNNELLQKNEAQLEIRSVILLEKFFEGRPKSFKTQLDYLHPFQSVNEYISRLNFNNPIKQSWIELCELTLSVSSQLEYRIPVDIQHSITSMISGKISLPINDLFNQTPIKETSEMRTLKDLEILSSNFSNTINESSSTSSSSDLLETKDTGTNQNDSTSAEKTTVDLSIDTDQHTPASPEYLESYSNSTFSNLSSSSSSSSSNSENHHRKRKNPDSNNNNYQGISFGKLMDEFSIFLRKNIIIKKKI